MATVPPPPDQPLPDWMSYSLVTYEDGSEGYTIIPFPLTYYGPSISLGTGGGWTFGGSTSPAETLTDTGEPPTPAPTEGESPTTLPPEGPTPTPEPATVTVTETPEPVTVTVTETVTFPATTVYVTAPIPTPTSAPLVSSEGIDSSSGSILSASITSITLSAASTFENSTPTSSVSTTSLSSFTSSPSTSPTSSLVSSSSATLPLNDSTPTSSSSSIAVPVLPPPLPPATVSSSTTSNSSPAQDSALPSVTGTARTYLGLAPNAFLGLILAIVFSLLILIGCLVCWVRHRRRRRRKELEAYPPPTAEQGSRLLAGDRDPTREDLAHPYAADPNHEYRRSQIAMMRARGELDDDWEDHVHSPSIRTASLRLPEEEIGTAYGFRERAFAAAGVRPPYGYTPVPRESTSIGSGLRSIGSTGNSTAVPTVTPTTAGTMAAAAAAGMAAGAVGVGASTTEDRDTSPTPRKDTQSTQATNDSSAIHWYAQGGRSHADSHDDENGMFYAHTTEGEGYSPVASSSDMHFLSRVNSQRTTTAAAAASGAEAAAGAGAAAGALSARTRTGSDGSASSADKLGRESSHRIRNLEEVPRSAIAYPESPVSDDQENTRLMPEGELPTMALGDTPSRSHSRSTRESGLSRWMHDRSNRSSQQQQQQPFFQRMLNRVTGNRLSTQPTFAITPATPTRSQHPPSYDQHPQSDASFRASNGDFDIGNGLRFPRPPVHTGYSSGASTARDDLRVWGGILPSRWSFGTGGGQTPRASNEVSSGRNISASTSPSDPEELISHMEQGSRPTQHRLGVPIANVRDIQPQMRERPSTSGVVPLLGFGLRPPPPSAYPTERSSGVSSGRSTVYYDARSNLSTPMQTLNGNQERGPSALSRYDSPPPQPVTTLRPAQSAQSFQSFTTAPFLPPGLYTPDDEDEDILDAPPPMPSRDVRQARSLNTIFSGGTGETYGTASPSMSTGRVFNSDERARIPTLGLDSAPRIARSVPSDIAPSEAAEADLGVVFGSIGSTGRSSSVWRQDRSINYGHSGDILEEEPPTPEGQWKALSSYPRSVGESARGSVHTGHSGDMPPHSDWRLTLGQPVVFLDPQEERSPRHSHIGFGGILRYQEADSQVGSQNSRGSSNRTNVSHSRDIHSLRASEVGGSNGSKATNQTGNSHPSVSEMGQLQPHERASTSEGEALLSAFGPGPGRVGGIGDDAGDASDTFGTSRRPIPPWGREDHQRPQPSTTPARTGTPPSAPVNFPTTSGVRLVSSAGPAKTTDPGPFSAPVLPSRGWPTQDVPRDVTAEEGRRPSQTHSFLLHESPLPHLLSHSPGLSRSHYHTHSVSGDLHEPSRPGTSGSHSHTHGTHGAETTMGTMTEATTEDHHTLPEMPLSDLEHILPRAQQELKPIGDEDGGKQYLEVRRSPGGPWLDIPQFQPL